jgi:hypothetical protein
VNASSSSSSSSWPASRGWSAPHSSSWHRAWPVNNTQQWRRQFNERGGSSSGCKQQQQQQQQQLLLLLLLESLTGAAACGLLACHVCLSCALHAAPGRPVLAAMTHMHASPFLYKATSLVTGTLAGSPTSTKICRRRSQQKTNCCASPPGRSGLRCGWPTHTCPRSNQHDTTLAQICLKAKPSIDKTTAACLISACLQGASPTKNYSPRHPLRKTNCCASPPGRSVLRCG